MPVVGGGPLVKAGNWFTVMLKFWVTLPTVLVVFTVPVKVPVAVGVPVMAPALLKVSPVGSAPADTVKVGAG